jgi:cell division protein FtsL
MRRSFGIIVLALILAVAGAASLFAGRFERRMAIAQEDMAVLDFADPQQEYAALEQDLAKLPWTSRATLKEIRIHQAELQYWQDDYEALVEMAKAAPPQESEGEPVDPELLLLAGNASFRATQRGPQDKATVLRNLDATIHAYSETLRAGNERPDAAFNYELAVRLRAEIAGGKRKAMPSDAMVEDKSDSNMHGDPGEPPKDMKVEQFQIRIPMDPKDFKNSQEQTAGTGQARKRKG